MTLCCSTNQHNIIIDVQEVEEIHENTIMEQKHEMTVSEEDDDDDKSISSAVSSLHESMIMETEKRKERLRKFREKRRQQQQGTLQVGKGVDESMNDSTPLSTNNTSKGGIKGGIMTVRTVEESLTGNKITEMRKRRRRLVLKHKKDKRHGPPWFKLSIKDLSADESVSVSESSYLDDEDLSLMSGLTTGSTTSAIVDLSIKFSNCTIREYEVIPGSNPSVSAGAPIELGWAHTKDEIVSLDSYEKNRGGSRRLQAQMRMPVEYRHELLMNFGHSMNQIRQADKDAHSIRTKRLQTMQVWQLGGTIQREEKAEKIKKALLKPFQLSSRKKKKKEEKLLWASVHQSTALQL